MSRALIATLDQRLKPHGLKTFCTRSVHRAPWHRFPNVEHRWSLSRLDTGQEAPGAPVFVCHRVSLPTSNSSPKARELKQWARDCLAYAKQPQNQTQENQQ